ncbi:hypothetical protein C8J57DRAFT_1626807 [Mycena rebaudengoi]|nr:hypothetical protein C8J57DRAFT_1626807 [Mycena rebaudengoi]
MSNALKGLRLVRMASVPLQFDITSVWTLAMYWWQLPAIGFILSGYYMALSHSFRLQIFSLQFMDSVSTQSLEEVILAYLATPRKMISPLTWKSLPCFWRLPCVFRIPKLDSKSLHYKIRPAITLPKLESNFFRCKICPSHVFQQGATPVHPVPLPRVQAQAANYRLPQIHSRLECPQHLPLRHIPVLARQSVRVPFLEFRGFGAPPADVGSPGDVYIDRPPPRPGCSAAPRRSGPRGPAPATSTSSRTRTLSTPSGSATCRARQAWAWSGAACRRSGGGARISWRRGCWTMRRRARRRVPRSRRRWSGCISRRRHRGHLRPGRSAKGVCGVTLMRRPMKMRVWMTTTTTTTSLRAGILSAQKPCTRF